MTLQACYEALGGNYENVLGRLRSENLVKKFVLKFLDDPSFDLLQTAMAQKDQATAFRAAHTIKGVCSNLGFDRLYESSHQLTEALRNNWSAEAEPLFRQVAEDYEIVVNALRAYQASLPA